MFNPVAPYGYCFLTCICLCQISQIQTCVFVGPGFVSTSPAFMRSSASHPAGPHGRLAQKTVHRGREVSTQFALQFVSAVTAPPLVGCVVWSLSNIVYIYIINMHIIQRRQFSIIIIIQFVILLI